MLVVAIIGILAAIAIPKFANLVVKAKEAAVKGKLGTFRSAISLYYANNEGIYPVNVWSNLTTGPVYLDSPISISIPTAVSHVPTSTVGFSPGDWTSSLPIPTAWNFDPSTGLLNVNCTHTDSKGSTWSLW
jgi:type II secretory pathway pseudopilin PulG